MFRRFASGTVASTTVGTSARTGAAASMQSSMVSAAVAMRPSARQFHSVFSLAASLAMCGCCVLCFGSWANNLCNVVKYGRWRFRNTIDDVIMVTDYRAARMIGSFVGLLFWWYIVGPQKYRWNSNLEDIPGNKRVGPF